MATIETDRPFHESFEGGIGALSHNWGGNVDTSTWGEITGSPGVCLSTLGPGSSNLVNPVANAWLDRVPMLAISGQIESKREPVFTHQVLDHNRLFSPISKWATTMPARKLRKCRLNSGSGKKQANESPILSLRCTPNTS